MNVVLQVNGAAVELDVEPRICSRCCATSSVCSAHGHLRRQAVRGLHRPARRQPVSSCIMLTPSRRAALTTVEAWPTTTRSCRPTTPPRLPVRLLHPGHGLTARSLTECAQAKRCPSREQIAESLGGNLCRCGCYVKIIDAVQEVSS